MAVQLAEPRIDTGDLARVQPVAAINQHTVRVWDIGDWWNRGERYGRRAKIVNAGEWTGPSYANCRRAGSVAERFGSVRRLTDLSFEHHAIVAPLPDEQVMPPLESCRDAGVVAARWHVSSRDYRLSFHHHRACLGLNASAVACWLR